MTKLEQRIEELRAFSTRLKPEDLEPYVLDNPEFDRLCYHLATWVGCLNCSDEGGTMLYNDLVLLMAQVYALGVERGRKDSPLQLDI